MVNITPLIEQIADHLKESNIDFSIVKAGMDEHYDENHRVQLIMSQTYYSRYEKLNFECDYLIIDERHREYNTDRTMLVTSKLKPKSIIGLTATPYDMEGYALTDACDISTVSVQNLTDQKFLSPIKYYVPKWSTKLGLEDLRKSGSDYSGSAIDEKFNNTETMNLIVGSMNSLQAKEKKTLVFCNSIEQSELVASTLQNDGYQAYAIHSKLSASENDEILESFKNDDGKVRCLVSVSKLNIGFDVRNVELGVMLRPTKVRSLYIQTVGRLTRTAEGKDYAEFLDLAGVVMEHGFHNEIYSPPAYGEKDDLTRAKDIVAAKQIEHIVSEEPQEVTRKDVEVFIEELKQKEKSLQTMTIDELSALFDMSNDLDVIIEIAYRIKQLKSGEQYKQKTINWIAESWGYNFTLYPEYQIKWTKALKTRAKNIVRDGKKLASLKYFIDFLVEKKDENYF